MGEGGDAMNKQNGITIADVLKMDCMNQSKLIAGFKSIKNIVAFIYYNCIKIPRSLWYRWLTH